MVTTWTREETIARRATWNTEIKRGAVTGVNGKVDMAKLRALQERLGFTVDQLKAAVYAHDLDGTRAAYEARPDVQRERLVDAIAIARDRADATFERMHAAEDALAWHQREINERAVEEARAALRTFDAAHPEIIAAIRAAREAERERFRASPNYLWD